MRAEVGESERTTGERERKRGELDLIDKVDLSAAFTLTSPRFSVCVL